MSEPWSPPDEPQLVGRMWDRPTQQLIQDFLKQVRQLARQPPGRHALTHIRGGSDALPAPDTPSPLSPNGTASTGTGTRFALEDHVHALDLLLSAAGDLLTRNSTEYVRFPVGADGDVLTADSGEPTGLIWAPGTGGGTIFVPLTTVVGGVPEFVWDDDLNLVFAEVVP